MIVIKTIRNRTKKTLMTMQWLRCLTQMHLPVLVMVTQVAEISDSETEINSEAPTIVSRTDEEEDSTEADQDSTGPPIVQAPGIQNP